MKKPATSSVKASKGPAASKDKISEQDYEELKNTFDLFDEDGSGTIDPVEIQKVMEELGLNRRNPVVGLILENIRGANRAINFNEFLDMVVGTVG